MKSQPAGREADAGSMSAFIETLDEPEIQAQLPPCPDWPDLN